MKDKIKNSTTLAIVIFTMLYLIMNTILQFKGVSIPYMESLVSKSFYILMLYIGGEKGKNIMANWKK